MTGTTAMYRPRVKAIPGSFGDQEMVDRSDLASVVLPVYGRCVRTRIGRQPPTTFKLELS
jgi:hypothetical protein